MPSAIVDSEEEKSQGDIVLCSKEKPTKCVINSTCDEASEQENEDLNHDLNACIMDEKEIIVCAKAPSLDYD